MLVFFDESFRDSVKFPGRSLGALCGIAIPEVDLATVARDIFFLKQQYFDSEFAADGELKGKELLKNWVFKLEVEKGIKSKSLLFVRDLLEYIRRKHLYVFGCVCFDSQFKAFKCGNVRSLDKTFKFVFERIDMFMKIKHPEDHAVVVFDDRDFGTNKQNSHAITNFFLKSPQGLALNSIVKTPFFAISQAQNIGLQLADIVTTIVSLRFASEDRVKPYFESLSKSIFRWKGDFGQFHSGLKVMRDVQKKSPGGSRPAVRTRKPDAQR